MAKAINIALWLVFLYGVGWAGNNDFNDRKHQADIELARINKLNEGK